jgi:hypothetical protein
VYVRVGELADQRAVANPRAQQDSELRRCREVELSGLEPLTSCMPWEMLTFNTGECWPEMTRAARCRTGCAQDDGRITVKRS